MSNYPPPGAGQKTQVLGLDNNIAGLLCYLPVCGINLISSILWLVTEKENRFLRFHAMQSLFLIVMTFVAIIVLVIIGTVVGLILGQVSSGLSVIWGLIMMLLYFVVLGAFIILEIVGMVKAYKGDMWQAPIVGGIAAGKV